MDSDSIYLIIAIIALVTMSAYFSATETAFSSFNKLRMKSKAEDGNSRASLALKLSEDYDRLISTILIGNNIVNITASTVGTVLFTKLYADYGPTISTVVLTLVVLIFGEISPKSLAKEHAESFVLFSAPILRIFLIILRPLNFIFSQWKKLLNLIFKPSEDSGITEEELLTMVSEAENEGGLDQHESELIKSAIEFGELVAKDILVPRVDIIAIPYNESMDKIASVFAESGYSRLPVYDTDIDNIVGILHEKDFVAARYRGQEDIKGCLSEVHYTTANADLGLLLKTLQKKKAHMAIVVDEYGGTEGLVTMEDILEEIVGEIWDEHDEVVESIKKQADGCYLVAANTDVSDIFDLMEIRGDCEASTVSGWAIDKLGRLPVVGDTFISDGMEVEITKADQKKVIEVLVKKAKQSDVPDGTDKAKEAGKVEREYEAS